MAPVLAQLPMVSTGLGIALKFGSTLFGGGSTCLRSLCRDHLRHRWPAHSAPRLQTESVLDDAFAVDSLSPPGLSPPNSTTLAASASPVSVVGVTCNAIHLLGACGTAPWLRLLLLRVPSPLTLFACGASMVVLCEQLHALFLPLQLLLL